MVGTYSAPDRDGTLTYGGYSTNVVVIQDFGGCIARRESPSRQ
jgi:hypothetical protein